MRSQGIIIEGITGAGKTRTLKALLANETFNNSWAPYDIFREKEAFGEFMGELAAYPDAQPNEKFHLLDRVVRTACARAQSVESYHFLMERAHYSYYALLPEWNLYQGYDSALSALHSHVFLLWIPEGQLESRSLHRSDRNKWGDSFLQLYGTQNNALKKFETVQLVRYAGICRSSIPHTVIDTSAMDWVAYADLIASNSTAALRRVENP
ncbi:MAG: hypothetical protein ABI182_03175 [Candidatus Baltobacteraceae bacterium]